jgi:hypothetical protein
MTRKSGVKGKTVRALARAQRAAQRKVLRTPAEQLFELDHRPGEARRERARLASTQPNTVPVTENKKVAQTPNQQPVRRTRRRAHRQATKSIRIEGKAKA